MTLSRPASLTVTQRNTLAVVYSLAKGGYGATALEVGRELGLSESAAGGRLRVLRDKGFITIGGRHRAGSAQFGGPHILTTAGRRYLIWGEDE